MEKPVGKKITSTSPLLGALSALGMTTGAMFGKEVSGRDTALTDKIGDIIIDTSIPPDTNVWETGIFRESIEGMWVIIGQYESAKEAEEGHRKWVEYMKEEPACKLEDIDIWNLYGSK